MGRSYSSIPGASRFSKSKLDQVYKRGLGAYYSSGSRPGTTAHQWAGLSQGQKEAYEQNQT